MQYAPSLHSLSFEVSNLNGPKVGWDNQISFLYQLLPYILPSGLH